MAEDGAEGKEVGARTERLQYVALYPTNGTLGVSSANPRVFII